jgi:DNA-directed RNA polymerase subunit RPC12/RpoP
MNLITEHAGTLKQTQKFSKCLYCPARVFVKEKEGSAVVVGLSLFCLSVP